MDLPDRLQRDIETRQGELAGGDARDLEREIMDRQAALAALDLAALRRFRDLLDAEGTTYEGVKTAIVGLRSALGSPFRRRDVERFSRQLEALEERLARMIETAEGVAGVQRARAGQCAEE
jgi:hypothetical protein